MKAITQSKKQITVTLPSIDEVEFKIICRPSDIPIKGNAIASGNDAYDKEVETDLYRQLADGNDWAWCDVEVIARYKGMKGNDTLGACSYASEKDFIEANDYYPDMKERAYKELISEIESLKD